MVPWSVKRLRNEKGTGALKVPVSPERGSKSRQQTLVPCEARSDFRPLRRDEYEGQRRAGAEHRQLPEVPQRPQPWRRCPQRLRRVSPVPCTAGAARLVGGQPSPLDNATKGASVGVMIRATIGNQAGAAISIRTEQELVTRLLSGPRTRGFRESRLAPKVAQERPAIEDPVHGLALAGVGPSAAAPAACTRNPRARGVSATRRTSMPAGTTARACAASTSGGTRKRLRRWPPRKRVTSASGRP